MNARQAGSFLRAFGDGTRLRILSALSQRPLGVSELTQLLRCPLHRVSRHLRYLHARSVVEYEPRGKGVVYRLTRPEQRLHDEVLRAVLGGLSEVEEVQRDRAKLGSGTAGARRGAERGR